MKILPTTPNRNPDELRLNVPPLERGQLGYHYDLIQSVATHFGRDRVDLEALHQILTPGRGGEILAMAHGIAGRSVLALPTTVLDEEAAVRQWHADLKSGGASSADIAELQSRRAALLKFGKELRIEFFDRSVTAAEMQALIREHRLGLVSLDWQEITSDPTFRESTRFLTPAHVLPEIPNGSAQLYYPVVPLVGYTNRGEGMLVHTHIHPFVEIPTRLFERAREALRSERTVVFFTSVEREQELRTPKYHWALPGVFTGSILIRPEELPPYPEPNHELLMRGVKLAIAVGKPATENFHFIFPHFLKAASLMLAKNDPSGADIEVLENHILSESEKFKPRLGGSQYFEIRDSFKSGLRCGVETAPEMLKAIQHADRDLREDAPASPKSTQSTAVVAVSQLTGTREQVLELLKQVVSRAFEHRNVKNGLYEVSQELVFITKACLEGVKNFEAGSGFVESLSPAQRIIGQIKRFTGFEEGHNSEREKIGRLEYEHALCPRVLLSAALHGEKEERKAPKNSIASGSDDLALWDHNVLDFTGKGLTVGRYWYDERIGSMKRSYSTAISEMIQSAISSSQGESKAGDSYNTQRLAETLSRFPLNAKQFEQISAAFAANPGLSGYLSNPRNWTGEQILHNKKWITREREGEPKYQKAMQYLRDLHEVLLKGKESGKSVKFDAGISPIAMSSMLANMQAEGVLLSIVEGAVEAGIPLKDFVLRTKGKVTAAQQYESLKRHEDIEHADLYISAEPDGGLKLTELGANYILDLIDPNYPYHHTYDDSREFLQKSYEKRRRYY